MAKSCCRIYDFLIIDATAPKKYGSQLIENNVFYTAAARLSFYATIIRLAYAEVKTIL